MAIPLMALIIFPFSLGMLLLSWQSLFLTLLPLAPALRLPTAAIPLMALVDFLSSLFSAAAPVPPTAGIYSLPALLLFSFGLPAHARSSLSSGYIPAGHGQLVLWPFRRWL